MSLKSYFHPYLFLFAWRSIHPLYDSYSFLIFHLQTSSASILHSLCHHSLPPYPSAARFSMQNETKGAVCAVFFSLKEHLGHGLHNLQIVSTNKHSKIWTLFAAWKHFKDEDFRFTQSSTRPTHQKHLHTHILIPSSNYRLGISPSTPVWLVAHMQPSSASRVWQRVTVFHSPTRFTDLRLIHWSSAAGPNHHSIPIEIFRLYQI